MAKYMSLKFRWQITFYIWIKAFKCLTRNFNQLEQLFCSTFHASPHPRSLLPRHFRFFIVVGGGNKRANIFMLLKQLPFVHCQSSSVVLKSKKLLPFQHRLEPLNICRSVRWIYLNCKETFIQIFCNIFFALSSFVRLHRVSELKFQYDTSQSGIPFFLIIKELLIYFATIVTSNRAKKTTTTAFECDCIDSFKIGEKKRWIATLQ